MKKTLTLMIMTMAMLLGLSVGVYAGDFAYSIDSVTLTDARGEDFSDDDGICIVTAEITKNHDTDGGTRVWFAGYSEDGRLLNTEYTDLKIKEGETGYEVVELISSPDKIDYVNVFIWNTDSSITPLAEGVKQESKKNYALYDASLYHSIDSYSVTFRRNSTTGNTISYKFAPYGAQLYVNGFYYSDCYSASDVDYILSNADGDIKLILDDGGRCERVEVTSYVYARISSYTYSDNAHSIILSGFRSDIVSASGNLSVNISDYDIEDGLIDVSVTRNGKKASLSELRADDVVAIKFDINERISDSESIEIYATDEKIEAQYIQFDSETELYTLKDSTLGTVNEYPAINPDMGAWMYNGDNYLFLLSPFGELYDCEVLAEGKNFAIVERYVTTASSSEEYNFIQVMTLDGEAKTLYIDESFEYEVDAILTDMGIGPNIRVNAKNIPIENRIIEYTVKASNGRINGISTDMDIDAYTESGFEMEYNKATNKLGKVLSAGCNVLDATEYVENIGTTVLITDYRKSSLDCLIDGELYNVILVYRSNAEYCNAIITRASDIVKIYTDEIKYSSVVDITEQEISTADEAYQLNNSKLYVNGAYYADITAGNIEKVKNALKYSTGKLILQGTEEDVYTSVYADCSALGEVVSVENNGDEFKITLTNVSNIEGKFSEINLSGKEIRNKEITFTAERNNQSCTLMDIKAGDVVLIAYDMNTGIEKSSFINISASDEKVEAWLDMYNSDTKYCVIRDTNSITRNMYTNASGTDDGFVCGNIYSFSFDSLGRIVKAQRLDTPCEYAIVERYVTADMTSGTEYNYIQVMGMDSKPMVYNIHPNYEVDADNILSSMGIMASVSQTARNVPLERRIVKLTISEEDGTVVYIEPQDTYATYAYYNKSENSLGEPLSGDCTVLDATEYMENSYDNASINDYKKASIENLSEKKEYVCILSGEENGEYSHVIITAVGSLIEGSSDFMVAATRFRTSSQAVVNGEDVYTLSVMKDGASDVEKIYIRYDADVFTDSYSVSIANGGTMIMEGTVFFCTTDENGFVDKIHVVHPDPGWMDDLLYETTEDILYNISLPVFDGNGIRPMDWAISLDNRVFAQDANEEIQLLLAPVVNVGSNYVSVAPIKYNSSNGLYYIDTNETYDYTLAGDTNIYSVDMSGDTTGTSRFAIGQFNGIELRETDENGYAWLGYNDYNNYDFSQTTQMAFMMVVDGKVTNALVYNQ